MPGRMSNKDRIARMAAEKAAEKKEKATKKKTTKKAPAKSKARTTAATKPTGSRKLVWVVCDHTGSPVKTYPYPERGSADEEAARLTTSKGKQHFVRNEKVPME